MPSCLRPCLALLTGVLLLVPPSLAFQSPLSDQAVREAYFLGQRRDESMMAFLNKYTKFLPPPKTGPYISSVTFLTPFALLVQHSSRQSDYSAQRAALDHKAHGETVEISIEIVLTQSYGAIISTPTNSRSGSPNGIRLRSPEFWRSFKYRVFDGNEEITTEDLTGEPQCEQSSEPAPCERPGPSGRRRQPETSAPKCVIDAYDRQNPSLDGEHCKARVRPEAENRRQDLDGLCGAVAAEEHPGEHDPALGEQDRRDMPTDAFVNWNRKAWPHLMP